MYVRHMYTSEMKNPSYDRHALSYRDHVALSPSTSSGSGTPIVASVNSTIMGHYVSCLDHYVSCLVDHFVLWLDHYVSCLNYRCRH